MAQLDYLYERQEQGREHFLCRDCGRGPHSTQDTCNGLNQILELNEECILEPVPDSRLHSQFSHQATLTKRPLFHSASSIPHFSLDFPPLDILLRPFEQGRLVVLSGIHSSIVAELAAFRAQLPYEKGGLNSAVFFVDGGNKSDPYLFSSFAKQWRINPRSAMRRVATCRVFTMYQLADFVSTHLAHTVEDHGSKIVVISDILETFNEPELDQQEARRLLSAIEEGIEKTKERAFVLATLGSANRNDDAVMSWADAVVTLSSSGGNRMNASLLKHPSKQRKTSSFRLPDLLKTKGGHR